MSAIVAKENIGYRRKRVAESSDGPTLPQRVQFAHKFAGGEQSFSLLNMTLPTVEMPGFANPSATILAGAGISANPAALKLYFSFTGGRLVPFDSYRIYGTNIVFLGPLAGGVPAGAYVFGEIDLLAANPIVIGDGRFVRKSYTVTSGQTTVNLGFTYKVGVNLTTNDVIGDIKVYRGGQLLLRNPGNAATGAGYQEIDAGNGYGNQILLTTAGTGETIIVEMGYQVSPGNTQVFAELERLQGAILALAQDSSAAFGSTLASYMSANATELDRRSFGNSVLAASTLASALDNEWTYLNNQQTISAYTPTANSVWWQMTGSGNSLVIPVGTWRVRFNPYFGNNGTSVGWSNCAWAIATTNGTGTVTRPLAVSNLANVQQLSFTNDYQGGVTANSADCPSYAVEVVMKVTSGTATVYGCCYGSGSSVGNGRIMPYMYAERIKRS